MTPEQLNAKAMLQYDAGKKNVILAYLFLIFLGFFGLHRIYLRRDSGFIMLGLFVSGLAFLFGSFGSSLGTPLSDEPLVFLSIGAFCLLALVIWVLIDLFLLYNLVEDYNDDLVTRLIPPTPSQEQEPSLQDKTITKSEISG